MDADRIDRPHVVAGHAPVTQRAMAPWVRNAMVLAAVAAITGLGTQFVRNAIVEARVDSIEKRLEAVASDVGELKTQTTAVVTELRTAVDELKDIAVEVRRGRRWTFEDQQEYRKSVDDRFAQFDRRLSEHVRIGAQNTQGVGSLLARVQQIDEIKEEMQRFRMLHMNEGGMP